MAELQVTWADTYSFAQLAGNTSLFARRIPPQGMFASKTRRDRALQYQVSQFKEATPQFEHVRTFSKG